MAVKSRPGFKTNVDRTVRGTASNSVYLDIKPDSSLLVRFTPTSNEDGQLFFESSQHFRFKEDGEKRAWACLNVHGDGTETCPICEYLDVAEEVLESAGKQLVKDHGASNRWHGQVIPLYPEGVEAADRTFILGLSKTTAQKVSKILKLERDTKQPLLTDPDKGQAIQISREGAGFNTKYEVLPSGVRTSLDDLLPGWEKKFLNVEKALKLRVVSREDLLASMKETFGNVVFEALTEAAEAATNADA
jgi:hypothetical protein